MTARRSSMAGCFLFIANEKRTPNNEHRTLNIERRATLHFDVQCSMLDVRCSRLQNDQIIAMHHFAARHSSPADLLRAECRDSAREFRSSLVANADDLACGEFAFTARHAGWQEAPA